MNDFNEFLNILRSQPTANKTAAERAAASQTPKAERPEVPKSGVLARPIGGDLLDFTESLTPSVPAPEPVAPEREAAQEPAVLAEEAATAAASNAEQVRVAQETAVPAQETEVLAEETEMDASEADSDAEEPDLSLFEADAAQRTRVHEPVFAQEAPVGAPQPQAETEKTAYIASEEMVALFDPVTTDKTTALDPNEVRIFVGEQPDTSRISAAPIHGFSQEDDSTVVFADEKTKHIGEKGSLLRAIAKTARESDQADGQIVMEGFDSNDPVVTDESAMEAQMRSVREKRIEDFGLPKEELPTELPENTPPPKTKTVPLPPFIQKTADRFADRETPFAPVGTEEYRMNEDRKRVSAQLRRTIRKTVIHTLVHLVLGLILLLANLITTVSASGNNGFFTVFGADVNAYAIFNLVFFIPSAVLFLPDFKNAILTVLKVRARTEAALLGMYTIVFVQTVSLFFTELQPEHDYHLFTGACVLLGALYSAARIFWLKNTLSCFKITGMSDNKLFLRSVRNAETLRTLLCENNVDGVCVDFVAKAKFISDFLSRSADAARSAMPRSVLTPVLGVLCVVCGAVAAVVQGSPVCGLSAVAGAACMSFPVCGIAVCGLLMSETNRTLAEKKVCVNSLRDARNVVTSDHLAFGGKDLFRVQLVHTATVDGVSEKGANITAALLAKAAGDTLAAAFAPVLSEYDRRLPTVEELTIEEKLGVSAWVDNCRVLLGTREMLVNHNIQPGKVPANAQDEHYLYLAIEGNAVAVFTLHYTCREQLKQSLHAVAQTGVNLYVRTGDPNLTADVIQKAAELPENSVRIVPKASTQLFDRLYETVSERESAGIVGVGGFMSLCDGINEAVRLDRDGKLISYTCTAGAFVGLGAVLLLCATGSIGKATAWSAVLLQMIWSMAALFLPHLFNRMAEIKNGHLQKGMLKSKREKAVSLRRSARAETEKKESGEQLSYVLSDGFANEPPQQQE